jgi:hypothetical protein
LLETLTKITGTMVASEAPDSASFEARVPSKKERHRLQKEAKRRKPTT